MSINPYEEMMTENKIEDACHKYDFIKWNNEENRVEIYCDHHMLAALRKCEGYFVEQILNRSIRGRSWPLDFGIFVHACIEYMYNDPKKRIATWQHEFGSNVLLQSQPCPAPELIDFGAALWQKMRFIDYHAQHRQYKSFGGFSGVTKLLLAYWQNYGESREPLKIVATECAFGRSKEVYLGQVTIGGVSITCYYSGRIDIIVDDGVSLGVMDTKTTNKFDGDELTSFSPHEGMLGYVYALREVLKRYFPDQVTRPCNRLIINHVQVADEKDYRNRFKRTPLTYTSEQLDEWRLRQLSAFKRLYEICVLNEVPMWTTDLCSMWYYGSDCPYKELHRQPPSQRELIRKAQYVQLESWSPYKDGHFEEVKK